MSSAGPEMMLCSHFWFIAISIQTISLILAPEFPSLGNWGRMAGEERDREGGRHAGFPILAISFSD